jgi:hypothetical protein
VLDKQRHMTSNFFFVIPYSYEKGCNKNLVSIYEKIKKTLT